MHDISVIAQTILRIACAFVDHISGERTFIYNVENRKYWSRKTSVTKISKAKKVNYKLYHWRFKYLSINICNAIRIRRIRFNRLVAMMSRTHRQAVTLDHPQFLRISYAQVEHTLRINYAQVPHMLRICHVTGTKNDGVTLSNCFWMFQLKSNKLYKKDPIMTTLINISKCR